jgi:uncharacterized protein (TIGR03083 family)
MMTRTFAPWVEPIAARVRESRAELLEFARSLSAEVWSQPSPNPGWSCKDLLAHVAGDKGYIMILRAAVERTRLDPALFAEGEGDRANARDVEARRGWSTEALIAEIESDGKERDELMSKLTDADRDLRQKEFPLSLGDVLEMGPGGHDHEHLEQLRAALKGQA